MKEEKKKEADVEAAKIYEQFVQSFDGGADDGKTFLRGGLAGGAGGAGGRMGAPPGRGLLGGGGAGAAGRGGALGAYGPASGGGGGSGVPMPPALAG